MKKYLFLVFILIILMQILNAANDPGRKLLVNITTKNKVSHEKVFLNKNADKYKILILETENNSVKVTRLKLEFDDGSEFAISENFYVSRDDNFKEVYLNKPGKILLQISVYITSEEDRSEKTIFNIYGVK